jgi:hypothetical protein
MVFPPKTGSHLPSQWVVPDGGRRSRRARPPEGCGSKACIRHCRVPVLARSPVPPNPHQCPRSGSTTPAPLTHTPQEVFRTRILCEIGRPVIAPGRLCKQFISGVFIQVAWSERFHIRSVSQKGKGFIRSMPWL